MHNTIRPTAYNAENIITDSTQDGWSLGYIGTPWPGPWPKHNGDLFVTDPDGWQAGIAWERTGPEIEVIEDASENRWGVFQIRFPSPVMCEKDLIQNFHAVLPLLQEYRLRLK
jgi:hypothetical protein